MSSFLKRIAVAGVSMACGVGCYWLYCGAGVLPLLATMPVAVIWLIKGVALCGALVCLFANVAATEYWDEGESSSTGMGAESTAYIYMEQLKSTVKWLAFLFIGLCYIIALVCFCLDRAGAIQSQGTGIAWALASPVLILIAVGIFMVTVLRIDKNSAATELDPETATFDDYVLQRYGHLLPQHGICENHVPTRREIVRFLDDLNDMGMRYEPDFNSWVTPGQKPPPDVYAGDYINLWTELAPPEALPILLDLLQAGRPLMNSVDEEFEDSLILVLTEWGVRRPHPWLELVGARLEDAVTRPAALKTLTCIPPDELLPLLTPWFERINDLSEPEILTIISLFDADSPHSLPALQQLKQALRGPSAMVEERLDMIMESVAKRVRKPDVIPPADTPA